MKDIRERLRIAALPAILLSVTFGVCGPLQLYITNITELWFSLTDIWWMCVLGGFAIFAICISIALIMPKKLCDIFACFLVGVALGLYIQGSYIATSYGTLNGEIIDWSNYTETAIWNTAMWIICLVLPFILMKVVSRAWKVTVNYLSLAIIAVQIISLGILACDIYMQQSIERSGGDGNADYSLTNYGKFELSSKQNTIIFILDCYDSQVFSELLEEHYELKESLFQNFLYYPDTVGGATRTVLALPYILTGQPYISENGYGTYIEKGFESAALYDELRERNYNVGIYTNASFVSSEMNDLICNISSETKRVASYPKLAYYLYRFTACRYFPHVLKERVWMYSGDFDAAADQSGSEESAYIIDDALLYQSLLQNGITLQDDTNAFRIYHLMGAHAPYTLDAQSQRVSESSQKEQQLGVMNILAAYFKQMKQLGIYDNANIIVMADHGEKSFEQNPMLLIKRGMDTTEFTISNLPVSYANLHPTLLEMIGAETDGTSIFQLKNTDNSIRLFYRMTADNYIVEYEIRGNASDVSCVYETGNQYAMLTNKGTAGTYKLGTELYFDLRSTGNQYVVSGFSGIEADHTWTDGNTAVLSFPLKKDIGEDLFVSISLASQMRSSQRVGIYVNNNFLEWYKVTDRKLNFKVPMGTITTPELEIRMDLPDAVSPTELGKSSDNRKLCLGFYSMVIREVDESDVETEVVPAYTGGAIDFSNGGNCEEILGNGWHGQEEKHRWSSEHAELVFQVDWDGPQKLIMEEWSYIGSGDTEVYCNDCYIGTLTNNPSLHTETLAIPEDTFNDNGMQKITFVTAQATSPKEYGVSEDGRTLGIAVTSIEIAPEAE